MRSKKFASSSKTPKISNRVEGSPPSNKQSFTTTRNRRLRLDDHVSPRRLVVEGSEPASTSQPTAHHNLHEATKKWIASTSNAGIPPSFAELKPFIGPNEDMDLGSDDEELMSPDRTPTSPANPTTLIPPTTLPQAPPFRLGPNAREFFKSHQTHTQPSLKDRKERFESFLSLPIGTPPDPQGPYIPWRHSPPLHQHQLTNTYLRDMRKAPADDPKVFSRILRSGEHAWLGSEIGGDNLHQQESLDGSEITQSTITDASKKRPRRAHLMPSFEPREPPKTHIVASSGKKPHDTSDSNGDMLEEYSLPDDEVNRETEIVVGGKHYIHRKLDPGWVVKVSTTQNRPYYVHPDFGTTWQCPNSLPPRSKARTFRRSIVPGKLNRNLEPLVHYSRKFRHSPECSHNHGSEDLGTMSDLIKGWKKKQAVIKDIRDGYDASVSCNGSASLCGTSESEVAFSNDLSGTVSVLKQSKQVENSEEEEIPEWITPMRAGMATPQSAGQHGVHPLKNKASTPHLSPIVEDDTFSPPVTRIIAIRRPVSRSKYDSQRPKAPRVRNAPIVAGATKPISVDRESASDKSTPRVSFERSEVEHRSSSGAGDSVRSESFAARPVTTIHHQNDPVVADTLTLDTNERTVDPPIPKENRCELVVGSIHHSSRRNHHQQGLSALYTPREFIPMEPSEKQDAPKKRHIALSLELMSHRTKKNAEDRRTIDHQNMELDAKSVSDVKHDRSESSGSNIGEWSPRRHETEQASMVTQERRLKPPCLASPASNEFPAADDFDFSSPSISKDEQTNCNLDHQISVRTVSSPPETLECSSTEVVQSPLSNSHAPHLPKPLLDSDILSPPRLCHKLSSRILGTAESALSNCSGGGLLEYFELRQADDYENRTLSPPRPHARRRPFNWRVTRPLYPICALQRVDELLKEQHKRKGKAKHLRGKSKLRKMEVQSQKTKHHRRKHRPHF